MKRLWIWLRKWYWKRKWSKEFKGIKTSQLPMPIVPDHHTRGAIRRACLDGRPWEVKAREKLKRAKKDLKKRGK